MALSKTLVVLVHVVDKPAQAATRNSSVIGLLRYSEDESHICEDFLWLPVELRRQWIRVLHCESWVKD